VKRLAELFWEFLRISTCVIGGGYAILAVAEDVFARKGWTKEGELLERLSVFQMIPGLIATHTAVYVGLKVAGGLGALVAVIGAVLPAVVVFTLVSVGYATLPLENAGLQSVFTGLRAGLTSVIAAVVIRTVRTAEKDAFYCAVAVCVLVALGPFGLSVPLVLVVAMLLGLSEVYRRKVCCGVTVFPMLVFLKYGLLGFGGGFVLVPMYLQDFVGATAAYLQLSAAEFSNVMALSQATPGPVGVNCATYFGYRLAGVWGALASSALLLLPGSLLAYAAFRSLERFRTSRVVTGILRGVRPASLSLMLVTLWVFTRASCTGVVPVALTLVGLVLLLTRHASPIAVILGSGTASLILHVCANTPA